MKTIFISFPKLLGQSYFEKYQNYTERKDLLESQINKSESKFEKRLGKARLMDKSREYIYELKSVEKEMIKRGCSSESVFKLRAAIKILKQTSK